MYKNHFFMACLLGSLIVLQVACKKTATVCYYLDEVGCNNPWDSYYTVDSFSIAALEQSIYSMLQDNQIKDATLSLESDSSKVQLCYACHCTTGRIVVVRTRQANAAALRKLGFYP